VAPSSSCLASNEAVSSEYCVHSISISIIHQSIPGFFS
jgi:hypothetical protein